MWALFSGPQLQIFLRSFFFSSIPFCWITPGSFLVSYFCMIFSLTTFYMPFWLANRVILAARVLSNLALASSNLAYVCSYDAIISSWERFSTDIGTCPSLIARASNSDGVISSSFFPICGCSMAFFSSWVFPRTYLSFLIGEFTFGFPFYISIFINTEII